MRFSCEKALLQSAVNVTSRAVSSKSSSPRWRAAAVQCSDSLLISGYNMQTGIRTKLPADIGEEGEIVVNARLFGDIIRRMPDDIVVFQTEKNNIQLSCGDSSFAIPALSAEDYPGCGGGGPILLHHASERASGHDRRDPLCRLHQRSPAGPHRCPV